MKVVTYVRVSTQEQAKEGYSIGEQTERLNKYCDAMGWEITHSYIDPGYSGGDTERPALKKMIADIENEKIDKVVVYKLDRLSRSQKDTLFLIEDIFLKNNTDFVSMNENFDTSTPFGRAMIGILAVFAQLEREQIKERMNMGKEARAKEGKWGGGSADPVGYNYNVNDDTLYINDYEAMQIKEAVELFLRGTPVRTIETMFREKGYKYRGMGGVPSYWDCKRLKYVFKSKLYLGYIKYRGKWYKSNHEPIIDEETYDKMQKLLKQRAEQFKDRVKTRTGQTTYLGGLIYCKHCGGRYCRQAGKKWKDNPPPEYYSCYSRNKSVAKMIKDPNCKNKNWRKQELEDIVFGEIRKLAIDPGYLKKAREEREKQEVAPDKIKLIQDEIEKINAQISRFMDLYGVGTFTIEQVGEKVEPLNEQRRKLENELEQLTTAAGLLTDAEILDLAISFADILDCGEFDEIKQTIDLLIHHIELDNDDVYIHWNFA